MLYWVPSLSMWRLPQFSALYPEMVDAVVLLDSYGFLPTDQVLFSFLFFFSFLTPHLFS